MAALSNPLESFIWGSGGAKMTPEQVARQREIAAAMMNSGMDYSPVSHWAQGLARAAQAGVGALKDRWAGEAEQRGREGFQKEWESIFPSGGASPVAAALAGGSSDMGIPISESSGATVPTASMPSAEYSSSYDPALFDWSRYAIGGAASRPDSFTGLDQNYAARIADLVTAADAELGPGALRITSAYRSPELQAELYRDAVAKYGSEEAARKWVAPPGRSKHNSGLAVDFANSAGSLLRDPNSPEAQWIANNASRFGLDVPMSWEPWQVELPRNGGASAAPARTQVAQAGGTPSVAQLLSLAGNEWANPGQSSVVSALLGQAMQQQDPRYQQQLRQGDLDYQRSQLELEAMMNPSAPKPIEVGGVLLDPVTYEPLFDSRTPSQPGFDTVTIDIPGVGPQTFNTADPQQYQIANDLLAQGATEIKTPAAQVNIGAETGYDSTVGKGMGERYLSLQDEASTARSALNSLDIMEQAMSQPGFYSGFGADQLAQVKKLGQSLGLNVDGIDSMEAFNAQAKSAALDTMGGSLGTGFSNADRDFVLDQVPTLSNTPQGNAALIKVQRAINQRKIDVARLSREYAASNNGRLDAGFDDYLADWAEKNPLFPDGGVFGTPAAPSQNTTSSGVTWSFVD